MLNIMKHLFCLLIFVLLFSNSTYAERYVTEGQKSTNIDFFLDFNSGLNLPTEGDAVKITFSMTPHKDIQTIENYYVDYVFVKPDNQFGNVGYASFAEGPYLKNKVYNANTQTELTTPGIWKIYYIVTTNNDSKKIGDLLFNSSSPTDYSSKVYLHSREIHVLSFYEANSIKISNNSLRVSIIGVVGTFLAFILGLIGNSLIDRCNNSPKIKVTCSHGFVTYSQGPPLHVFSIEAINYGRVAITLSGVGIDLKKQPNREKGMFQILNSDVVPVQFPIELMPGKSFTIIKNYRDLKDMLRDKLPLRAYFKDQVGNTYYSKNIKKMFKLEPTDEQH